MSVTYTWYDDDKTIVHVRFNGRWTWDEVFAVTEAVADETDGSQRELDVIADMRETNHMPMDVANARRGMQPFAPKHKTTVYVDPPRMMRMGLDMVLGSMGQVLPIEFEMVDTMDEAAQVIQRKREGRK